MTYPEAIQAIQQGKLVFRTLWKQDTDTPYRFLCLRQKAYASAPTGQIMNIASDDLGHCYYSGWNPSDHKDANDWEIVDEQTQRHWDEALAIHKEIN